MAWLLGLGWCFHPLSESEACCSAREGSINCCEHSQIQIQQPPQIQLPCLTVAVFCPLGGKKRDWAGGGAAGGAAGGAVLSILYVLI